MSDYIVARSAPSISNIAGVVMYREPGSRWKPLIQPERLVNAHGSRLPEGWSVSRSGTVFVSRVNPPAIGSRVIGFGFQTGDPYPGWVSYIGVDGNISVIDDKDVPGAYKVCSRWIVLGDDMETAIVPHSGRKVNYNVSTDARHDEKPGDAMSNVLDKLSDDEKKSLAQQAIKVATDMGYCDETKNVLRSMGLPVVQTLRMKVDIEVEYDGDRPVLDRLKFVDLNGQESTRFVVTSATEDISDW